MGHLPVSIYAVILVPLLVGCALLSTNWDPSLSKDIGSADGEVIKQKVEVMVNSEQLISAQVLLVPATGPTIDGSTPITSENINDYYPSEEVVQRISKHFTKCGFEVSPLVGISLTISGTAQQFSDTFSVNLSEDETGRIQAADESNLPRLELPLTSLNSEISSLIVSVTFTPLPDFGPTNFSF